MPPQFFCGDEVHSVAHAATEDLRPLLDIAQNTKNELGTVIVQSERAKDSLRILMGDKINETAMKHLVGVTLLFILGAFL